MKLSKADVVRSHGHLLYALPPAVLGLFIKGKHFHEWCSFSSSLIYLNLSQFEYQLNKTLSLGPHGPWLDEYHFLRHSSTVDTQIGWNHICINLLPSLNDSVRASLPSPRIVIERNCILALSTRNSLFTGKGTFSKYFVIRESPLWNRISISIAQVPRRLTPPADAVGFYTDPANRGYLADP